MQTAIIYYDAAIQYGTTEVKKTTFNWLLVNLLSFYSKHGKWLELISADLLSDLISSPNLVVMQTEFALYALLKVWIYMKLHPNLFTEKSDGTNSNRQKPEVINQSSAYFTSLKNQTAFLLTKQGARFAKPFKKLRLQHLINHPVDIKIILEDNIIPRDWLNDSFMVQWNSLIKIDNCLDSGYVNNSVKKKKS